MAAGGYHYVVVGAGSAGCVLANPSLPTRRSGWRCWKPAGRTGVARSAYRRSPNSS
jgi:hypothetical protein